MKGKKRNNAVGVKGKSGRKPKRIEFKVALDKAIKERDAQWLNQKANNIAGKVLNVIDKQGIITLAEVKEIILPLVLKGMADNFKIGGDKDNPVILGLDDDTKKILSEVISKRKEKI